MSLRKSDLKRSVSDLVAALKACSSSRDLKKGREIHKNAARRGEVSNIYVASSLVNMYAKCGSVEDGHRVFNKMPQHNAVSWTSLMLGYAEKGDGEMALDLFWQMRAQGCAPDARAFVAAAKSCSRVAEKEEWTMVDRKLLKVETLDKGTVIHLQAAENGFDADIFLGSALIDMYANCGSMGDAQKVFDKVACNHDVVLWNSLISGYADNGQGEVALEMFARMRVQDCAPNARTRVAALRACTDLALKEEGILVDGKLVCIGALEKGMAVHSEAARKEFDLDIFVETTLVDMYAKCGSMLDSRRVFDRMRNHNTVTWNALVLGYAENGDGELALRLFELMRTGGCRLDGLSFIAALKACICLAGTEKGRHVEGKSVKLDSLKKGMYIHYQAAKAGYDSEGFTASTLLDMYAKCGSLADARRIFDKMRYRSTVSWNILMLGYIDNGEADLALDLFAYMEQEVCQKNSSTFVAAIKACANIAGNEEGKEVAGKLVKLRALEKGMGIHSEAAAAGFDSDSFVATTLVDMYAKCGSLLDSRRVFDRMVDHSVVSWNALILGYAENGEGGMAWELFEHMRDEGKCVPNALTYVSALKACASLASKEDKTEAEDRNFMKLQCLEKAMTIHAQASDFVEAAILLANTLVDTYGKCGSMVDARLVFDKMHIWSVVSWTVLMTGYVDNGEPELALEIFSCMPPEGVIPNALTFVAALKACSKLALKEEAQQVNGKMVKLQALDKGAAIHSQLSSRDFDSDISVAGALVDMYLKCGSLETARGLFDAIACHDAALLNALMLGYIENGEAEAALELFFEDSCPPNTWTIVAALKACIDMAVEEEGKIVDSRVVKVNALERGVAVHSQASSCGFYSDTFVASRLVDMYAKCGSLEAAWRVFNSMHSRDAVMWTLLMLRLIESGEGQQALKLYARMQDEGCKPDTPTFIAALKAFGSRGCLESGKALHADICRYGLESDTVLANSLVDGYGKSGSMIEAQQVFDSIAERDSITFTSLIAGYSRLGDAEMVLSLFGGMLQEGLKPDGVTFLCILAACSHAGLVEKAQKCFSKMPEFGITAGLDHYHCMVDVLARANDVENAMKVAEAMPHEPNDVTWRTVLAACKKWKNVAVGRAAFDRLVHLNSGDVAAYMLMESIYASRGMRSEQAEIEERRMMMKQRQSGEA